MRSAIDKPHRAMKTPTDEKELAAKRLERRISGRDLKKIREKCGYSAREFANLLRSIGARITTTRSVYRLEERREVEFRYVEAMIQLVGKNHYERSLSELILEGEERERWREEMIRKQREEAERCEREREERRARRIAQALGHTN
jgi:DNA-binding transcriptional regulator YiaG